MAATGPVGGCPVACEFAGANSWHESVASRLFSCLGVHFVNSFLRLRPLTPHSNHKLQKHFGLWSLWLGEEDNPRALPPRLMKEIETLSALRNGL
jgi:hypothetical protein